jgi:energy-coupling factor transporter ATP-binding protein EcfA2
MATITQIEIEGFKAFPKNFKLDLGIGKNLLIYGENGSGKSSLYYALHVLLQSVFKDDKGAKYFKPGDTNGEEFIINNEHLINIFRFNEAKDNTYTPYVRITFDDGKVWRLDNGGLSSENGADESEIKMLNKNSAFINHSYISRFHAARNSEEIDLWNVFYKDILPFHLPAGETQFLADLYNEIVEASTHKPSVRSLKEPIDKFNNHLYNLVSHINKNVNTIYNENFRNDGDLALNIQIVYLEENNPENNLHEHFYLAYDRVRDGKTIPLTLFVPRIGIKISEDGRTIYKPQSHFNEAKLTAIALAIRFAAMTTTVITQGSFLALDDMLISLDMSNRAKVVDFLLKISDKYKIYLFTHDKMFFEYFKHKTKKNQDAWIYKEIYMDYDKTPYIRNSEDYLGEAEHYIKQHEYEIAGNFLRKAAELLCKNFLPNKWQLSPDYSRLDLNGLIHNSKRYAEECGMTDISVFEELDSFRKFILNPASHDSYDVVKYRYEVELCLQTLMVFKDIDSVPFLNRGDKLCFELKCKAPSIDIYKFELILCDNFRIIKQPGKTPLLSKGMINYRVIKNDEVGTMQSDNTTIKSFYDKCYEKSDKSKDANFFNSVIEAKSGNAICTFI